MPPRRVSAPPTARTPRPRGASRRWPGRPSVIGGSGSKAPVLTLPACAQTSAGRSRPASASASASGRIRPWPSVGTRVTRSRPRPSICERGVDRDVRLRADDHRRTPGRRTARPLDVPARPPQERVAPGGQARERGHRGAGREPHADPGGQPEQLRGPRAGDLLGDRGCRPDDVQARVLVPRARQPVGAERGRQPAADHEAEEPRPRAGDQAVAGAGRRAPPRSRPGPRPAPAAGRRTGPAARRATPWRGPGAIGETGDELAGELGGPRQRGVGGGARGLAGPSCSPRVRPDARARGRDGHRTSCPERAIRASPGRIRRRILRDLTPRGRPVPAGVPFPADVAGVP